MAVFEIIVDFQTFREQSTLHCMDCIPVGEPITLCLMRLTDATQATCTALIQEFTFPKRPMNSII